MGLDAQHSLRISFGWATTQSDVDRLLERMPRVVGDCAPYSQVDDRGGAVRTADQSCTGT